MMEVVQNRMPTTHVGILFYCCAVLMLAIGFGDWQSLGSSIS